jgi:hypothetical protein
MLSPGPWRQLRFQLQGTQRPAVAGLAALAALAALPTGLANLEILEFQR